MNETHTPVGISGFSVYVPPFRVPLEHWCQWNDKPWDKISTVVGRSFRMPGRHESVYTMAANAVLRLIDAYDVDPEQVGHLALGTESSTDNSTGAVIVRGMIDDALEAQGRPRLSRACEVPEIKHACLGGVYAVKGAVRYLSSDGRGRKAIVVSCDFAEYERGSTGEQTQGAGGVAILLEENPTLARIDLQRSGSSSAYRGVDFRKPVSRHAAPHYTPNVKRLHDFPVFNGKYSTFCYLDAVTHAVGDLLDRSMVTARQLFGDVGGIFFHRPYHWMPVQAMATLYVWGLARSEEGRSELGQLCAEAGIELDRVHEEIQARPSLFAVAQVHGVDTEPYPLTAALAKQLRATPRFTTLLAEKMRLGADKMMEIGNIYTAALPAWLAAGFEDALEHDVELTGKELLAVGYGSGDAAEALTLQVVDGWQAAAAKISFDRALDGALDLQQAQYEALHDGMPVADLDYTPCGEFVVERVGSEVSVAFQDIGIEYYRWVAADAAQHAQTPPP